MRTARSTFDERKAAEAAAFFLYRAGGRLSVLKLVKLLYLAERLSLERYGDALTGDCLVSMPHGPVLSTTLNHIDGLVMSAPGGWDSWISTRENHDVALADPGMIRTPEQDLRHLSESDLEVLDEVWKRFGHMEKWSLRDYTHEHLPEWRNPEGSCLPISYRDVFEAFGLSSDVVDAMVERLEAQRFITSELPV